MEYKKLKVAIDFSGGSNYSPLSEQDLTYMPQPLNDAAAQLISDSATDIATNAALILLKEDKANKSINVTTDATSDIKYPSVKAIKTYVDANIITGSPATATNTTDITTNTTDIATNVTNIAGNTTDITGNTTDIATNVTNISGNTTDITTNATDILSNSTDIATNAALILTMSSGAEVAKDTMVIPITILGIFNRRDKATADFRSQLPPAIKKIRPRII